ncbi:hypothetical protein CONPUDRAFT_166556 [Coniophora puteana RWD-64-598 SS2]|uniref:Uncharacterized protein n=1 Tax=Coniophora puteana (strain RWD-64-598) TaxID=741705 RepID=A0A5M3MKV4_CONPW|nr:uncharacterized protein CONPUDRAFT_166556 [Coniophora puteana RWD-64-598 SS2]EIW79869.1 hypothetical protein CONPUDRAFT_166556 [Coniophora puteana RWD-64-598 SS2]
MANRPEVAVRHGLSGFGPRNAMLFKGVVLTVLAERENLRKLGSRLKLEFVVFEKQPEANAGSGNAFQVDCAATINTPMPGPIPCATWDKAPAEYQPIITPGRDLSSVARQFLEDIADEHRDKLRKENSAAYKLFVQSLKSGHLDLSGPSTTRGTVGRIQQLSIKEVLAFVEKQVPEISVKFYYNHTVKNVDFSSPTKPKLLVCHDGDNADKVWEFDFVHLANGTTWALPITDEAVIRKSFSETQNVESVGEFLSEQGLLDEVKLIKKGTKLGVTGISLSAYDPIPIILQYTQIIEITEDGYQINEDVAKQYQGLFTFISRSNKVAPPRHHSTRAWPGKKLPGDKSFINMDQAHAMFLQRDFDWVSFARDILYQSVSYEIGTTPSHVHRKLSAEERMSDYHQQTLQYTAGKTTENGLIRAGYHALLEGFGFERDPEEANKRLLAKAPLTRLGRGGALMRRSAAYDITRFDVVKSKSNSRFLENWKEMQQTYSSSPIAVHDIIAQLFVLGVATHSEGNFRDIKYDRESHKVVFKDFRFDAMFAPKVLSNDADEVLKALHGKVKTVYPGGVPEYTKGRFLQTPVGDTFIHATDAGSGGNGVTREITHDDGTASRSRVGLQWTDTNSLASCATWSASASRLLVLLSVLQVTGSKAPVKDLMAIYNESLPGADAFRAEIDSFKGAWSELVEKKCFLDTCQFFAKDAEEYQKYASDAFDPNSRQKRLSELSKLNADGVETHYTKRVEEFGPFDPVDRDEYLRRFVDFTSDELDKCWGAVFKFAHP